MAVNKVVFNTADGEQTLIDLTNDTATVETVFEGVTFHAADGEVKTGTFTITEELTTQDDLIAQIQAAVDGLPEAGSGGGNSNVASITVNASYGTTIRYIGTDGLATLRNAVGISSIQIVIPSICFIEPYDKGLGFSVYNVSGGCSTLFQNNYCACVEITSSDANIVAVSNVGGGG